MKKIIMEISTDIAKTALVENGKLIEILIDDKNKLSMVGNVYCGKVADIFKDFAFIDIGGGKKIFLQQSQALKPGQLIIVQVLKDESKGKNAFGTMDIELVGTYIILKKDGSTRLRTAGKTAKSEDIEDELITLRARMEGIFVLEKNHGIVYSQNADKPIYYNSLKALLREELDQIVVNKDLEIISEIAQGVSVVLRNDDIFNEFEINHQLEQALKKKVWLRSGGFLIIEPTEALTVIDVNTGKLTARKKGIILKNNMEAAKEIAKQLRLRNLSGIIIIDFVNMDNIEDKQILLSCLKQEVKKDRIICNVVGITTLGLVEMTRKKTTLPIASFGL